MAYRFNPPPGWPQPPQGWRPPEGWQPDPSWPAAPDGWVFWVAEPAADAGAGTQAGAQVAADPDEGSAAGAGTQAGAQVAADPDEGSAAGAQGAADADEGAPAGAPDDGATSADPTAEGSGADEAPSVPALDAGAAAEDAAEAEQAAGPGPGWGGVPQQSAPYSPQQPMGQGPAGSQPPASQGPGASAPAQPQWGTVPEVQHQPPGGYQQPGPAQPGGYAGTGFPQQGGAQHPGGYTAAPPPGSGSPFGGPSAGQTPQQSGPFGPGDASGKPNRTPLIVGGIAGVVILALLIVLGVRLIGGGDEQPEGDPTPSASAPATTDPTDAPTTSDPTDDPTDQQTGQQAAGDIALLAPGEAAEILGVTGEPEVTAALMSVERNWEPEGAPSAICPEPTGEYIALEFEFTTLPALADGSETYSFIGFELGLANADGTGLEVSAVSGLFCLSQDQQAPADIGPGETVTGWAVVDAPSEATMVTWAPFLDFTGKQPTYAWNLADF